ncbi:MAG TPA: HAMP domain-containing protein [Rhodobacteraceae bacterium]|nr:HAMP domain-containing protein [Paracoccaceae bacterium]
MTGLALMLHEAGEPAAGKEAVKTRRRWRPFWRNWFFSSLTRRIVVLNLVALALMVSGIFYLNQFRAGLIDAKVQSLRIQGQIIAGAIAAAATIDEDVLIVDPDRLMALKPGESLSQAEEEINSLEFPINPERAAPILRRLITPTHTRARIFDREGVAIVDSNDLFSRGQILRNELPPPGGQRKNRLQRWWKNITSFFRRGDLPVYKELAVDEGLKYPEVVAALRGASVSMVRVNKKGELIIFMAVPIQRFRAVLGALVLSTKGGDIDAIISAERWEIMRVFLVAGGVTVLLSVLLAGTIAGPVQKLAAAAERVRAGPSSREEIPDFTGRHDEIGHLSGALRDMTSALYDRIDAIERFAADVAHELKNPLTSLRSAVETQAIVTDEKAKRKLQAIILEDVKRLDRLISDISAASRLDAEIAREDMKPVNVRQILGAVVSVANDVTSNDVKVSLDVQETGEDEASGDFTVLGRDLHLGQVTRNLLDNAISFSPPGGEVRITLRSSHDRVEFRVEDEGPGVDEENQESIFQRFYTDRPGVEAFGKNSGLGLSISRQIVLAHKGTISVKNRLDEQGNRLGACFTVSLPALNA